MVGGTALSHQVMVFLALVGSLNLYFLHMCRLQLCFIKNPTEWSMANNSQVGYVGCCNKGTEH